MCNNTSIFAADHPNNAASFGQCCFQHSLLDFLENRSIVELEDAFIQRQYIDDLAFASVVLAVGKALADDAHNQIGHEP
jgi:hypothetical protein